MKRAIAIALLYAAPAVAQRFIPANREQLNQHLRVEALNLRGTHFYVVRNETIEAFWSRFDKNKPSIEFRLGQLARAGANSVRLWSSYRSYLQARKFGFGYPGGATQTNGHWGRVKEFCDIANEYDIGVALVLFNTFGEHVPSGGAFATVVGTVPSPRIQIPSGATSHLDIYLEPSMDADGNPVIGKYDKATLWVGHPDVLEATGFVRDMPALFRHGMTWLDGSSGGNNADFVHDYLDTMNAAGVTQSPGQHQRRGR